jgi:hypothetical protein
MTMTDGFATAMRRLDEARRDGSDYAQTFVDLFPVNGTAVSTIGDVLGSQTVSASDRQAERLDELQFDLGEGPCWDALRLARPILEPDLRNEPRRVWPAFSEAIRDDPVGSIFAFPVAVGPLRLGAVDMYAHAPATLGEEQTRQATAMAEVVGRQLLQNALASDSEYRDEVANPFSRRIVHQATGMVLAQLNMDAGDARLVIQGHAFAAGRSMIDVSQDILDGRLDFSTLEGGAEATG